MPGTPLNRVHVLGVPVDAATTENLPEAIEALIQAPGMGLLAPVNIDIVNKAVELPWLREFLNGADIVHSDGAGVVLGARLAGHLLPPRVTSIHLLWTLCERWADGQHSFYFLGGPPGVNEKAVETIQAKHPGLRIAGCFRGHLSSEEEEEALADIAEKKPDILCVGFGTPIQEEFIVRYRERLRDVPVVWPVGALTTHIAAVVPRAPALMRKAGMEWAWRLALEPRRMWRRYVVGNPLFVGRVLKERLTR